MRLSPFSNVDLFTCWKDLTKKWEHWGTTMCQLLRGPIRQKNDPKLKCYLMIFTYNQSLLGKYNFLIFHPIKIVDHSLESSEFITHHTTSHPANFFSFRSEEVQIEGLPEC
uniref:Uncharacterized protein n=1 Tax=Lygus hesperus TaxID=30085 RepID=A0A0K8SJA1_LYGHE